MNQTMPIKETSETEVLGVSDKAYLGFWIYLMTDLLMFAVLFACYAVLKKETFGGPNAKELFDLQYALTETFFLLTSSFTCGLGILFARRNDTKKTILFFALTFLLGSFFLGMELTEFSHLFAEGNGPQRSAFLSAFFSLVGTHGAHITAGLIWLLVLFVPLLRSGLKRHNMLQKLTLFSLFWHFLDLVWIFVFTIVYLFAGIQ